MKAELLVYKIISSLLLPVAVIFGLSALFGLLSVLVNPSALFGVLIIGAIVFYIICSFIFLTSVISGGKPLTASLRSRMRFSAVVTIFFCVMMIYLHLTIISNPEAVSELIGQMMKQPGIPDTITPALLEQGIKGVMTFFMIISLVLLLHIIMSFRLLKRYGDHKEEKLDIEN